MKNLSCLMACCAIAIASVSCNKINDSVSSTVGEEEACLSLSLDLDDSPTKSSTAPDGNDSVVSDVQILVFDSKGKVASYLSNGTSMNASVSLKLGTYTVAAVVNGPVLNTVNTLSELRAKQVPLMEYNNKSSDFVMYAESSGITVDKSGSNTANLSVSRLVSRAKLATVKNGCPQGLGALTLKYAYLSNVVNNQVLGGDEAASVYSNQYGRSLLSNTGSLIDGSNYKASPEDLTFVDLGSASVAFNSSSTPGSCLYSYPNLSSDTVTKYSGTWTPTAMRLVLCATLDGEDYYYPVALPATAANTSYDVSITIKGTGLKDPQGDIEELKNKGTVKVTLLVADWKNGDEYTVEY